MAEQGARKKGGIESIVHMDSHYPCGNSQEDIIYCRNLVQTAMDFLIDLKNQDNELACRRDMVLECLDSAIEKLNTMLDEASV